MTRLRFTLAQLMAIVLFIGFGFAALRNPNDFWMSATYTLAFLMISVAPLGAIARKGRDRMAWAGFAVFGWARLLVGALPYLTDAYSVQIPSPRLLTTLGFAYLMPWGYSSDHARVSASLEIILFGLVGAIVGRLMAGRGEQPNP
jgi:hypothetical protein